MLIKNTIEADMRARNSMEKDMEQGHSTIAKVENMLEAGSKTKCMVEEFSTIQTNRLHMMGNGRMISCRGMELSTINKYHLWEVHSIIEIGAM